MPYFAYTDDAWGNQKAEIMRHLDKADIIPLDLRYLTDENRVKLIDFVLSLIKVQNPYLLDHLFQPQMDKDSNLK